MKVLVTGGAGFIGSHVVDRLRLAGHEPVVFDTRRSPWHDGEVPHVVGDMLDRKVLERAMESCDAVAHLAAAADVGEVAKEPVRSEEINARGTLAVLEAARQTGVKRVVYASTIWVYDGTPAEQVDEDTPLGPPVHLYTATKLAGEHYCRAYGELYGLESTILRFGIPYGPRAREAAVVPSMVNRAMAGEPLTVAGDGKQTRRFVYVEDLAEGVVRGLAPQGANRTYNLVGTEETSIREIADRVCETVGDVPIEHVPARAADFKGAVVSAERAKAELGWETTTCFAEGVRRYVEWRHEQPAPKPEHHHHLPHLPPVRATARGIAVQAAVALVAFAVVLSLANAHEESRSFLLSTVVAGVLTFSGVAVSSWVRRLGVAVAWLVTLGLAVLFLDPSARAAVGADDLDAMAMYVSLGAALGVALSFAGHRALRLTNA